MLLTLLMLLLFTYAAVAVIVVKYPTCLQIVVRVQLSSTRLEINAQNAPRSRAKSV